MREGVKEVTGDQLMLDFIRHRGAFGFDFKLTGRPLQSTELNKVLFQLREKRS